MGLLLVGSVGHESRLDSHMFHDPVAARANLPLGTFFWLSAQ